VHWPIVGYTRVYAVCQPPVYFAGVYSPQLPYVNRVYAGYTLSPSKNAKYASYNTKMNTIRPTSQQMVFFQARNALKTVFGRGFAPDPTRKTPRTPLGNSLRRSLRPLVGWRGGHPVFDLSGGFNPPLVEDDPHTGD